MGHNNYIEGRSYITISEKEAQELVNKYAGTGELLFASDGKWRNQEIVRTDRVIGYNVSDIDGPKVKTKNFKIHYSKKGTHIVPKKGVMNK
ncbi:polymorphic toxin type 50 domain-containing protein [Romboutsia maritimum]|uniref:polymorphic toxin type 50 domain-containing protein n=1 Tax=Romboutsia maritimum TaxID=2020948 RepID=UPI0018F52A2A|nr:polymorphic toxin type 50 domain-containing protein [Romboutsia maritimum]